MKNTLKMALIAAPALSLSSFAFAGEPSQPELVLSSSQMDGVTAGFFYRYTNVQGQNNSTTQSQFLNLNVSPALGIQALTFGSGQYVSGGSITQSNGTVQVMK